MKGKKRAALTAALAGAMLLSLSLPALAVESLVPMGCAVGIELETDGVAVAGFSEIETENGTVSPAAQAGMKSGDVITAVNGRGTRSAQELLSALAALDGGEAEVRARRGTEELLFRGGVQTDLQLHDSGQGPFVAIGITAAIFALVHLNPAQMPAALVIGILLGFAYWWTGSLVAPILIHVFNNSFACAMAIFSPDNDSMISFLGGRVGAGIAAVVSLFCLVLVVRKIGQESKKDTEIA